MTNLQAAVGAAQMNRIDAVIRRKREIAQLYCALLRDVCGLTLPVEMPGCENVYWMMSILVDERFPLTRDELMAGLRQAGVDSRPFFYPLDTLPPYASVAPRPAALDLSRRGLNLPSAPTLSHDQVRFICRTIRDFAN